MHRPVGTPVELGLGHLEQRDAAVGGDLERLAQPPVALGALGDVQPGDRYAGPQRLDDRVAAGDPLVVAGRRGAWARRDASRSDFALTLWALWLGRSAALGVGPLPSRPRRTRPPDPAVGRLDDLRIAPLRWLFPGISRHPRRSGQRPLRPVGGVLDGDAGGSDPVTDRVGTRPVLRRARAAARSSSRPATSASTAADSCASSEPPSVRPGRVGGIEPEHVEHRAHRTRPAPSRCSTRRPAHCCPRVRVVDHSHGGRGAEVVVHGRRRRPRGSAVSTALARRARRPDRGTPRSAGTPAAASSSASNENSTCER